jgi:RNA polymerase-binding transcription factor DksA
MAKPLPASSGDAGMQTKPVLRCEEADHRYEAGAYGVCRRCGGEYPIRILSRAS